MAITTSKAARALQEKRVKKLIKLIKKYNKGFKTTTFPTLVLEAGFPATTGFNRPVTFYNRYPDAPKLNSRQTQVNKAVDFLLDEKKLNQPAIKFKNFKEQIAKLTGLPTGGRGTTLSSNLTYYLQKSPRYKEFEKPLAYINIPASRVKVIQRGKNFTFADVVDMYSAKPLEKSSRGFSAYESPTAKIFDYAKRHVAKGGKKIQFLNEKEFLYKGKKYDADFLTAYGRKDKNFKEFFKAYDQRKNLYFSKVKHPVTNKEVFLKDLLEETYQQKNTLDIDHIKGIEKQPFTNLRIMPTRINQAAGNIKQKALEAKLGLLPTKADDYTPDKVNKMLDVIGYNITKNAKELKTRELETATNVLKKGGMLQTPIATAKEIIKQNIVSKATNNEFNICEVVFGIKGQANGGQVGGGCGKQMELEFDKAPEQTLNKIAQSSNSTLKGFAQRSLSLFPKLGTVGKIATVATGAGIALSGLRYNPEKGEIVTTDNDQKADQNQILEYVKDNPLKVTAGTSLGFAAQEVPGAYKAARDLGRGRVRSTLGISGAIRPVLTTFGTPLLTGLYEGAIGSKRLDEGETMTEVLTDPLGPALGVSLMEPLSKLSGVVKDAPKRTMLEGAKNYFNLSNVGKARPGITGQILRMGMSPKMIAGASRFLGLPGLALGLGMSGYDAYKNYQNQEGMIYNLFNRDE